VLLASITGSITSFVGDHGVYAVFALLLVGAILPVASELVLLYAGALASGAFASQHVVLFGHRLTGGAAFVTMAAAGALGYVVGAMIGWQIGRHGGRPFVERYGRFVHVSESRLARAERWFDRREDWAVPLGVLTPVVRSFVAVPAGIFRIPFVRFTLLTIPSAAVFSAVFVGIGWAFGSNYERFHRAFDYALVAGAALVVLYVVFRLVTRRASRLKPRA
jgi:membrane protein DedA with SNARE-associated domain